MQPENDLPVPDLPSGRFVGQEAFVDCLRLAMAAAAQQGWRELIFCDPNFAHWPWQDKQMLEGLHAWSRAGRHCTILAANYDFVSSHHARFVSWRRNWSHLIDGRICRQVDPANFPIIFWSANWTLQVLDPIRSTGVSGTEPERIVQAREQLQQLLHVSGLGFAATTLGL